jgi:uncharacterized protein YbgA (DUF1722 family)
MDVFKKYQNILVPMVVCVAVLLALKQFHALKMQEVRSLGALIAEGEKKIQLAESINEERERFLQKKKVFISEDADNFLNRLAGYARKVDVEVLSVRLLDETVARSRRRQVVAQIFSSSLNPLMPKKRLLP